MPERTMALLDVEEACCYAEWVNQHTGLQTAVVPQWSEWFSSPTYAVRVWCEHGGTVELRSREQVARFVNERQRDDT